MVPSWMLERRPIRIQFTSPRMTTHIQTLLSSPISTSPITCALSSTKALGWMRGRALVMGESLDGDYMRAQDRLDRQDAQAGG